jgi:hypothetical protein
MLPVFILMLSDLQTKLQNILSKPKSISFVFLLVIALSPIHSYLISFMGSSLLLSFYLISLTLVSLSSLKLIVIPFLIIPTALYFTLKHFVPTNTKTIKQFFLLLALFPAFQQSIYYYSQSIPYSLFKNTSIQFFSLPSPITTLALIAYLLLTLMVLTSIFSPISKKFFLIPMLTLYFTFLPPSIHTSIHIALINLTATSPVTVHISPTNKVTVYSKP